MLLWQGQLPRVGGRRGKARWSACEVGRGLVCGGESGAEQRREREASARRRGRRGTGEREIGQGRKDYGQGMRCKGW